MQTLRRSLLAVALATCAIAAHASPITYDFNGSFSSGPLAPQPYSGYFTFDSSAVTAGGINSAIGLLSDLSVTIDGIAYDENTANTGGLVFDGLGALSSFLFGTDCGVGFCSAGASDPGSWYASAWGLLATTAADGGNSFSSGSMSYALRSQNVPEPASAALLGLALAGLAFGRRKKF